MLLSFIWKTTFRSLTTYCVWVFKFFIFSVSNQLFFFTVNVLYVVFVIPSTPQLLFFYLFSTAYLRLFFFPPYGYKHHMDIKHNLIWNYVFRNSNWFFSVMFYYFLTQGVLLSISLETHIIYRSFIHSVFNFFDHLGDGITLQNRVNKYLVRLLLNPFCSVDYFVDYLN